MNTKANSYKCLFLHNIEKSCMFTQAHLNYYKFITQIYCASMEKQTNKHATNAAVVRISTNQRMGVLYKNSSSLTDSPIHHKGADTTYMTSFMPDIYSCKC